MPLWFIVALAASISPALYIFIQKIGAERGYNSNLLNTYSAGIAAMMLFAIAGPIGGYHELSWSLVGVSALNGCLFITSTNLRMDAFKHIDATVFLPQHKVISSVTALVTGIFYFKESMCGLQWAGIALGIAVPLLLITKHENARQKHLAKGLLLMVVSAICGALAAAVIKQGTDMFRSTILLTACSLLFTAGFGVLFRKIRCSDDIPTCALPGKGFMTLALVNSVMQASGFALLVYAYSLNGPFAIVYLIFSFYIVIAILLSVIFFKEHIDARKICAIIVSIIALMLLK